MEESGRCWSKKREETRGIERSVRVKGKAVRVSRDAQKGEKKARDVVPV